MIGGFVVFCDDIRDEIGGKYSAIGCYRNNLVTVNPFPITLPKLGLIITWLQSLDEDRLPIELKVFLPGDEEDAPTLKADIDLTELPAPPPSDLTDDSRMLQAHMRAMLSPCTLKEIGAIRVVAARGGKKISLARFEVTHLDALSEEDRAQLGVIA